MAFVQAVFFSYSLSPVPDLMDPERSRRISTLVDSTFDLSLKQLRSFLDRECANDPELRAEVERRVLERETVAGPRRNQPSAVTDSLVAGEVIAERYRITRLIGRGGMGEVYEAYDLLLKEDVALKTLRADLAGDESLVQRFQKEISLARKVTHPNVCRIFEVGVHSAPDYSPLLFFAMELLEGETLSARIRTGRLARAEAFPIAVQLAEGLQAAHRVGIVHADFKSANVILVKAPGGVRAVITDFGVARLDPASLQVDETHSLADTGRVAGTIAYMSPEQLAGDRVTTASDIYSFGIVLFEMASGERPFDERDLVKAAMLKAAGPAISVRARVPDIDQRWEAAIARCLQKDPVRRFTSAGELANWFRDGGWWDVRHWTRRYALRASVAASLILAAGVGGWIWGHRPYQPLPPAFQAYTAGVDALHSMAYETARKSLEQAVAADPSFALAHASLARAYDELDYTDRAKDAMLRAVAAAQESRLAPDDERRLRATQFMVQRDYERAVPLVREIEADATARDRPAAALESGWLAQQMEDSDAAAAAFERALKLDSSYAAAKLRLGYMFGRRGGQDDLALALRAFTEAEQLYGASGDDEGVTQTLLERANLFVRRSRQREALPLIEKALAVARTVGNRYQEVRLLLLQGTALRDLDESARASGVVRQAIDMAGAENMDNLATNGQIDLGNIYLRIGDLATAEPIFQRALEMAGRSRVRRIEARARMALGSLYEQEHRPEQAKPLVQAGLFFYNQAGYRRESVQSAAILGGLLRQLGENDESARILREALPSAVRLQDSRLEAQLHERIADTLRDRSDWPEALAEYQRAIGLFGSIVHGEEVRVTAAGLQWRLGQREDATGALGDAAAFESKSRNPRLFSAIGAQRAEMAYADGRLAEAQALARQSLPAGNDEETRRHLTLLQARVHIRMGRVNEGVTSATTVIAALEQARLPGEAADARLSLAEALVTAGERGAALKMAQVALGYFEPRHVWEAVWRGHSIVARASQDRTEMEGHQAAAGSALVQLRTGWTAATVDRYLGRPDIKSLAQGVRF